MTFEAAVQRANQVGSKKVTIPQSVTGPDGEEIEIGATVKLRIVGLEKQDAE